MGACQRRQAAQPPAAEAEMQEEQAAGQRRSLDALTSVRRLPARRRPGQPAPTDHEAALSALRYRFGCRSHYLHVLKLRAAEARAAQPRIKLAFVALRCLAKAAHRFDDWLLKELKAARAAGAARALREEAMAGWELV